MAIKYTKGKKKLEYTGMDKVTHAFGNTLEKIKSTAKRVITAPARAQKRYDRGQAQKEIDDISRAFGSVERYVEFNPKFKGRADQLYKRAK